MNPDAPSPQDLPAFGRAVAEALPTIEPARLARQRARFVAGVVTPRRVAPIVVAAGFSVAAAAGLIVWLRPRPVLHAPASLSAYVGGSPLAVGQWIAAGDTPVSLRFSDGSAVSLAPGSHARVVSLSAEGARILLERGWAEATVRHGTHTRWVFSAGPYAVQVTGTAFALGWAPERSRFDLAMHDGSVMLRGPRCAEGIAVRGRDEAHADVAVGTLTFGPVRSDLALGPVPQVPIPQGPVSQERLLAGPQSSLVHPRALGPRPLPASDRAVHALLPTAVARPVVAPAVTANSASMVREADALRLAGHAARARELLINVRSQFGGSPDAARAAFSLGTLTLDTFHAPAEAARWFELCAREAPSSSLANTARGRRVEALRATSDTAAARAAAEDYLLHDGDGAFAPLARAIIRP